MPRPREAARLLGAALSGPFGAVPLEEALRRKLADTGLSFEGLRRTSKYQIHVLIRDQTGGFWPLIASLVLRPIEPIPFDTMAQPLDGEVLDDALYDAAVMELDRFLASRGTP